MPYQIIYHNENGDDFYDSNVYDNPEDAEVEVENTLERETYIDGDFIVGAEIKKLYLSKRYDL